MRLTTAEATEYKKCAESVVYTCKKYVYIKHIKRGKMKWKSYPGAPTDPCWQLNLLQDLQDGKNKVILKSRQVGVSWTVAIFIAWLIHFRPDIETLLLSQKEKKAIKLLAKVKYVCTHFPDFIRREFNSDTQTKLSVIHNRNGRTVVSESSVDSLTTTGESGRGDTARFVLLDELAHLDNAEETWTAVKPTTSHGGQIVAASSPKGNAGPFARVWMEADAGSSKSFEPMRVHYTDCGFDQEWLDEASDGMTEAQIEQEYELAFIGTGSPAFNPVSLKECYVPLEDLSVELMSLVNVSKKFATGVDSAEIRKGRSIAKRDYHAITSLNEYGIQIAAEKSQMTLHEWAGKTEEVADSLVEIPGYVTKWHRSFPGLMYIEENGAGLTVENRHRLPDDDISDVAVRRTTVKSKPRLVNQFALALAGHLVVVTDKDTYYQLLTYEDLGGGRYSAPEGMYDDLVIAILEAYDALLEMGGYDFDFSAVGAQNVQLVSPLDEAFAPGAITLPSVEEFIPSDPVMFDVFNDWHDLDPRRVSAHELRERVANP